MRLLKRSTVVKAFLKRGWKTCPSNDYLYSPVMYSAASTVVAEIDKSGYTTLSDARWVKRGNVHIVSYWGPFRNLKELEATLDNIEKVYQELCGTKF